MLILAFVINENFGIKGEIFMNQNSITVFCGLNHFAMANENGQYEKFTIDEFFDTILFPLYNYNEKCFKDDVCNLQLDKTDMGVVLKGVEGKLLVIITKSGWEVFELCVHATALDKVFTSYALASLLFMLTRNSLEDDAEQLQNDIYNWVIALLYKYSEAKYESGQYDVAFHSLATLVVKNEDTSHTLLMCGVELT